MFVKFTEKDYPNISVTFGKDIHTDDEYNHFIQKWTEINNRRNKYNFIVDARELESVSMKYTLKLISHLIQLKCEPVHYLQETHLLINSDYVYNLLQYIFKVITPLSKVHIYYNDQIMIINN
jgi:hypothetical protein